MLALLTLCSLSISISGAPTPCPFSKSCSCEQSPYDKLTFTSVDCTSSTRSGIPQFTAPVNVTYRVEGPMYVGDDVALLLPNHFSAFSYISKLYMQQKVVSAPIYQKWNETAFAGVSITELFIDGLADMIPLPAALIGLSGLSKLSIRNQGAPYKLGDNAFSSLPSLMSVELSGSPIQQVSNTAFSGLSFLLILSLKSSNLTAIPVLKSPNLDVLDLTDNEIKTVGSSDFGKVPQLSGIGLDSNPITNIDKYAFAGCNKLSVLSLFRTELTTFDLATLASASPNLRVFYPFAKTLTQLTVSSLKQFPAQAEIRLQDSGLQVIDSKVGDLLDRYPNMTIDIGSTVSLKCQQLRWIYRPVLCTKNLKISVARCQDIDMWLEDYVDQISPQDPCTPFTPTTTRKPYSGAISRKSSLILTLVITAVAGFFRSM